MNSKKVLILLSLLLIIIVTFTAYLTTLSQTEYQIAIKRLQSITNRIPDSYKETPKDKFRGCGTENTT